jgi:hypothetical protein
MFVPSNTLGLFFLSLMICLFPTFAIASNLSHVQNLVVEDVPNDDGSGLLIRFTPMPPEARIIEYRIYRGVSRDTLFYIGKIETDPRTVTIHSEMLFFDKDFRPFVDVDSPRRLRSEKGQPPNGPIFRDLPRDLRIVAPLLERFDILAIIDKDIYYKKTKKHLVNENGETRLLGGLRIEDFEQILANVKPGKEYFYTVVAVDIYRRFLPFAPIVSGIASDNTPESAEKFFALWLSDTQTLNFEWELPLFIDDIASHTIYMIHQSQLYRLDAYRQYMSELGAWNMAYTMGDTLAVMPEHVDNPGFFLHEVESSFPYISLNFCSVRYADGYLENVIDGSLVAFSPDNIADYLFYITLDDYAGFESISEVVSATVSDTSRLPKLPAYSIRNKPNSKGDTTEIIFDRPYATITYFNYRGRGNDKKRLQVAYSYSQNEFYPVQKIRFDFVSRAGENFLSVTEHFIDNVFNLTLPSERHLAEGFKVYISFYAPGTDIHGIPYLSQDINFDDDLMILKPDHLLVDGVNLQNYRYTIVKQSLADRLPRLEARFTPLLNLYDDSIPYERYIFKGISSFDLSHNHLLIDTFVDLGFDHELDTYIMTSLFLDDFMMVTREAIERYQALVELDEEDEEAIWYLEYHQMLYDMQTAQGTELARINQISNPKKRISELAKFREIQRRTFKYYIVKTDGEGHFIASEIYLDSNGNEWFFPTPAWFNTRLIPMLVASLLFGLFVFYFYHATRRGKHLFIRPIAGLEEIDNAIGRATEMGRPILFVPGLSSIEDVATLAGLSILGHITKRAVEYDTRVIVPVCDYIVLPIAQQIVKESHSAAGRPDTYNSNDIFFVAEGQFAYVAGVNGVMIRQKTATNFYMGMFFAEALIMTETGNHTGAIQIAGTDAETQIPFFITTCDYTLIGEELYAASAYLAKDPVIIGTLKSQDATKICIILSIVVGTVLSSLHYTGMINWLPSE